MYNIAVIGAGQLGSRHLQALLKSEYELNIYVVDPSESSLDVSKTRAAEIESEGKKLYFSTDYSVFPKNLFLAVIATNSEYRMEALNRVVETSDIEYLVLEKVLFQNSGDYVKAEQIIADNKIKAYVNCPRRMFEFYNYLKVELADAEMLDFVYTGGNWGMACNSVHILDLYCFLYGRPIEKIDISLIESCSESKRKGYYEVNGILAGTISETNRIVLKSDLSTRHNTLIISTEQVSIHIDETTRKALIAKVDNGWNFEEMDIDILYQSEMTNLILKSMIETGRCNLTPYTESMQIHWPLIDALTGYFETKGIDGCPIT